MVTAIKENDNKKVDEYLKTLMPRLVRFLRIHMNASINDAKDCAQESFLLSLEVIKQDKLQNPERILSYLLTSCRNNYLKMQRKNREQNFDEVPAEHYHKPGQLSSLMDKERNRLLKWCMEQLKKEYRKFMEYWFEHPDYEAEKVAEHFDLSVSNTWTRKHRIIKKLNKCYQKKSEL